LFLLVLSLGGIWAEEAGDKLVNCGGADVGPCLGEFSRQFQFASGMRRENMPLLMIGNLLVAELGGVKAVA
jgi:hypothetical protein